MLLILSGIAGLHVHTPGGLGSDGCPLVLGLPMFAGVDFIGLLAFIDGSLTPSVLPDILGSVE